MAVLRRVLGLALVVTAAWLVSVLAGQIGGSAGGAGGRLLLGDGLHGLGGGGRAGVDTPGGSGQGGTRARAAGRRMTELGIALGVALGLLVFALRTMLPDVFTSDPAAYRYLARSIAAWPDQRQLAGIIRDSGWERIRWKNLSGGIVALHHAIRPD